MFKKGKNTEKRLRIPEHKKVLFIFCVIFTIYALTLLFVFGYIFLNSFKTEEQYWKSIWAFPASLNFSNYVNVWKFKGTVSFVDMFKNSLILCTLLPTISCFVTSGVSYTLAKFKFKGRSAIYFIHILPMMFSIAGTQASMYILLDSMNLIDTFGGLALTSAGAGGMNFLLLYGTYKNISDTYIEAAEIDGAGDFRIYFQIMMPQALGIIGTIWMFGFINTWNDYATVNLYLFSHPTVAVGLEALRTAFTSNGKNDYPKYYAALVLSLIPIITLFMLFQEQIMNLSLGGGIKG